MFLLQLVLFQLAEEIGFTGFLQHHWQDRYHPMKLTLYVALLWAVWHMPDHFAEEGWGVEALISAPVIFAIGFVSLFFARALFVWFYNRTGSSVLLVAIFHASFDACNQPALLRRRAGVEHSEIPDLQRGDRSFRSNGDHRHQRQAGTAPSCGARRRSRRRGWRAHTRQRCRKRIGSTGHLNIGCRYTTPSPVCVHTGQRMPACRCSRPNQGQPYALNGSGWQSRAASLGAWGQGKRLTWPR